MRNNWIVTYDKILVILILIFAGTSAAIDAIMGDVVDYNITGNIETEITDTALFSWWIYWFYIIINSIINGLLIWVIGGWWFNIRLKLSGDNESDVKKCRLIAIYSNMLKSIPILMLILISSIFFPNIYSTYSNKFIKILYSIIQDKHVLYYIVPQKGFYNDKNIFTYDLTYLSKSNSITLNFSFLNKNLLILDSISLCINDECVSSKLQKIFIEHNKNKWQCRYSSKFSFNFIYSFLQRIIITLKLYYILVQHQYC